MDSEADRALALGRGMRRLSCQDFAGAAARVRDALSHYKVHLHSESDLGKMLRLVEWVGQHEGDPFATCDQTADSNKRRLGEALLRLEQVERIGAILQRTRLCDGAKPIVRWVKKRLDEVASHTEKSQDRLFELEIGSRLVNTGGDVIFDEPDVRVEFADIGSFGVACKRPRSAKSFRSSFEEASSQIRNSELPGVVVMSLDAILHNSGTNREWHYWVEKQGDLKDHAHRETSRLMEIDSVQRTVANHMADHVIATVLCSRLTAVCRKPSSIVWSWNRYTVPNLNMAGYAQFGTWISSVLGEPL